MFRPDSTPRTFELLWADAALGAVVAMYYKDRFNRRRPVQFDPAIEPISETPGNPSYPSGHSTQAHLVALSLGQLFPRLGPEFRRLAWHIGLHREIAGFQFRSDSEAGRSLAQQMFSILLICAGYVGLLVEAKAEWSQ